MIELVVIDRDGTLVDSEGRIVRPMTAPFAEQANETGVIPSPAIIVGDTEFDLEMAAAASILGDAVTYGAHSKSRLLDLGSL